MKIRAAEVVRVAEQRHAGADAGVKLDGRTEAGGQRDTRGRERAGGAGRRGQASTLEAIRPTSPDTHGRVTSSDQASRSGQASTLAASSANDAAPPGSGRSFRQAWVAPTNSAGDQTLSRSSAIMPVSATPGITAGAGPKIV